jgi:hypothetical protein
MWRAHRWEPDLKNQVTNAVQSDAHRRLCEALATEYDEDVIKWALQSQHRYRIDNVVHLAKSRPRFATATASGWDADPWLLGVPNGVVSIS